MTRGRGVFPVMCPGGGSGAGLALMTARRSHLIGVMTNIRNSFHAEMVEDIVEAADRAGYEVVLGAVEARTDTNVLVGSGDVVVQAVS